MLEITKIQNGFNMNNKDYSFESFQEMAFEIISDSQVHIGTNDGIMLLDLSVLINGIAFSNINDFTQYLFN